MGFDIIGDVHGNADALEALLRKLGYRHARGAWRPPSGRKTIFVGDFIDRGPRQLDVLTIARSMIDNGDALAVLGNHELNAAAWWHGYRPDTAKNRQQHHAFLTQVGEGSTLHAELASWFLTLPLWLELPGVRVVHACWDASAIGKVQEEIGGNRLSADTLGRATSGKSNSLRPDGQRPAGDPLFCAVETLTKGLEMDLPLGISFRDKDGHERWSTRLKWWLPGGSFAQLGFIDHSKLSANELARFESVDVPSAALPRCDDPRPVFFGHYWMTGEQAPLGPARVCVDYSAGRGGPLVAYRWNEGDEVSANSFVTSG